MTPSTTTNQLTPAQLKVFEFNISRAKTQILLDHPFWAVILLKRELILDYSTPTTARINRRSQIKINPNRANKLSVAQLVFLLCHEIGHEIFDHINRCGARNGSKWNVATDAVINDLLIDCGIGQFIDGGVEMPGSKDKTAEQVYSELPEGDESGPGGIGSDIDASGDPMTQAEMDAASACLKVELAQAAQAAKSSGTMSAALEKIIAEIIAVKTPWYTILERFMVGYTRGEYTWSRPNRRFAASGYYLPSTGQVQTMGTVVIQIDVSGSISRNELNYYNGHLSRIVEQCQPEKVHVIYTDTDVQRHDEFDCGEEVQLEFYSGGGTDMRSGVTWCDKNGITPDVLITLSDGYTPFPDEDPGFPMIWCLSSDAVAPVGETIHFSLGD